MKFTTNDRLAIHNHLIRGMHLACILLAASSCAGSVSGDGPGKGGQTATGGGSGGSSAIACSKAILSPVPMRRLTRDEYNATVRDLFGEVSQPADGFPPEEISKGTFGADARYFSMSPLHAERMGFAAIELAPRAMASAAKTTPCITSNPDKACARAVASDFGSRAFRRPLREDERDRFAELFATVAQGWDAEHGMIALFEAMLQSPHFLYRVEFGLPDSRNKGRVSLSPHELATRLSYYLWGTMPDKMLSEAASSGELSSRDGVLNITRRMMSDPRSRNGLRTFVSQWLELYGFRDLGKDPKLFPSFTPALQNAMVAEAEMLVDDLVWSGAGLEGLMTATHTFGDPGIAALRGTDASTNDQNRIELHPEWAAGVLTLPAVLAAHSKPNQTNPVVRGRFLRSKFLCQEVPDPPMAVMAPDLQPGLSTRARFSQHSEDASCANCHRLMDPLGFGLEAFDAIGRPRTTDETPIDDSGEIVDAGELDGPFKGVVELGKRFARSQQVSDCFAEQWFQNTMGRALLEGDACSVTHLQELLANKQGDVRELMIAITQTDAFMYMPEVTQ